MFKMVLMNSFTPDGLSCLSMVKSGLYCIEIIKTKERIFVELNPSNLRRKYSAGGGSPSTPRVPEGRNLGKNVLNLSAIL